MKRKRLSRLVPVMNIAAAKRRTIERTNEIRVDGRYFLSSFYDKDGAWVRVISKSTKTNRAGWPSTVEYEVLEPVGDNYSGLYAVGKRGTCNASNLYEKREYADPAAKARQFAAEARKG